MGKKEPKPIGKGKAAAMGAVAGTGLAGVVKVLGVLIGTKNGGK